MQFGKAWADVDRNGCDTRNDVLTRDLASRTYVKGTRNCVVYSGTLADAYSGRSISFVRGVRTSSAVQVDHVVALSDAWQKGAQSWDTTRRTAFANDPLNLVAADGPLNAAKGDGDAATWLPPARASRCAYVARQVAVKVRYGLWMTKAEHEASGAVLATCPSEPLPTGGTLLPALSSKAAKATAKPTSKPTAKPTATPSTRSIRYEDCDAVRAAGKAPIRQADPGFRPAFDRDGDGVGCDR
ncbi:DUF1524 domain-containing protein [Quadrisphaera sp. INWT6]|uniref:GmrSD restriction endonuclease domain-containing protein n=1 Tax=Quadrisphaera sp. INWT6 TaxID=2596917 RepID=UPI0019D62EFB|nr:DUF1524 domain-containing protein [Quadrisphaera sp. INWT6]